MSEPYSVWSLAGLKQQGSLEELDSSYSETARRLYDVPTEAPDDGDFVEICLAGSLLCGNCLYQHMNAKIVLVWSMIFGGLGTAILPDVAPNYWIAHIASFVSGFSAGALECGECQILKPFRSV